MSKYRITFTPAEPYFFGNEKSFIFPGQKDKSPYANSYFIRGENLPSQSTILGALRYLMIPNVKADRNYADGELDAIIGKNGFNMDLADAEKDCAGFGIIKKISPVFLTDGEKDYIRAPFDMMQEEEEEKAVCYSPFSDYTEVTTSAGKKLACKDYDCKKYLRSGFISVPGGEFTVDSAVFSSETRIGINRSKKDEGFFKKEYKMLSAGYSFAVYADIENDIDEEPKAVYMGQGKSPFSVRFKKADGDADEKFYGEISEVLSKTPVGYTRVYCLSDSFVKSDPCGDTLFTIYGTATYRSFVSKRFSVQKGSLYRLIKAGSVFITETPADWTGNENGKFTDKYAETAGYNKFIIIGGNN